MAYNSTGTELPYLSRLGIGASQVRACFKAKGGALEMRTDYNALNALKDLHGACFPPLLLVTWVSLCVQTQEEQREVKTGEHWDRCSWSEIRCACEQSVRFVVPGAANKPDWETDTLLEPIRAYYQTPRHTVGWSSASRGKCATY